MKALHTWKMMAGWMENDIPVMLLYVLESKGSSPGRQGFFMAVSAAGEMEGSIGGGIMEHKFVEMAKEQLRVISYELRAGILKKQVHDKSAAANQSGMICSGEQTIWLYPVKKEDLAFIRQLIAATGQHKNGTLHLSPDGIRWSDNIPDEDFSFRYQQDKDWQYKEKTGYRNKLFIIGGGHCALALSRLMQTMDFHITVIEDRQGLKTLEENNAAHEKKIVSSYSALPELVPAGPHHYVVIMTVGYRTDDIAIRALMNKPFRYIGVLGSKKKMETLLATCRAGGLAEEWLQRIHTPVGLSIHSQTPEEIAVSIAAQIIQVKNQPKN